MGRRAGRDAPKGEVAVLVVNDGWNTAVGVVLGVLVGLVFAFLEVEVDRLVGQAELLQNVCDLPENGPQDDGQKAPDA